MKYSFEHVCSYMFVMFAVGSDTNLFILVADVETISQQLVQLSAIFSVAMISITRPASGCCRCNRNEHHLTKCRRMFGAHILFKNISQRTANYDEWSSMVYDRLLKSHSTCRLLKCWLPAPRPDLKVWYFSR